ncbi:hypothetical protein ABPG74_016990 [Tetrahymena malaccensis]
MYNQQPHFSQNPNPQVIPPHSISPQIIYSHPHQQVIYPQELYGMYSHMDYAQMLAASQSPQPQVSQAAQYQMPNVSQTYPSSLLHMPQPVSQIPPLHQPIPFSSPSPQNVFVTSTPPIQHMQPYMIHPQMNYSQIPPQQNSSIHQAPQIDDQQNQKELDQIVQHILNLKDPERKEEALQELSRKRESFNNLAPLLWHSNGTIALLIDDIVSVYSQLAPNVLTQAVSTQVCSVLGLLQCLALHPETKPHFIKAHIPLFLYPFLNTSAKLKPFENLRVTSLGVIGALVKGDDTEAITFLMQTEIIPLCLRIMKRGQELSRTVATFIVQKILIDDNGLNYICQTAERFFAVSTVLQSMIEDLEQNQKDDQRLLRHIIKCYQRLSENNRANEALKKIIPQGFKDPNWSLIKDDSVRKLHHQLMSNLGLLSEDTASSTPQRVPSAQSTQAPSQMMNHGMGVPMYIQSQTPPQQQQQAQPRYTSFLGQY